MTTLNPKPQAHAAYPASAGSHLPCAALALSLQVCSKPLGGPVGVTAPPCSKSWIVQPGNTCWALWTRNNLSQAQFMAKNPGILCQRLHVGQSVCVG